MRPLLRASLCTLLIAAAAAARPPKHAASSLYTATAYSDHGLTASGQLAHRHVVAADPTVLPIGSRIKIRGAGRYSGEYVVADTGSKVEGHKLDIFIPNARAAKKFGIKPVRVFVVEVGDGTKAGAKEADHAVKADVAQEVAKGAVGNAATNDDVVAKTAAVKAASVPKAAPVADVVKPKP